MLGNQYQDQQGYGGDADLARDSDNGFGFDQQDIGNGNGGSGRRSQQSGQSQQNPIQWQLRPPAVLATVHDVIQDEFAWQYGLERPPAYAMAVAAVDR